MQALYNASCTSTARLFTQAYSTSFNMGIRTLAPHLRGPIYSIYGFVRVADEIVDTFFGYEQEKLLADFSAQTWEAIRAGISTNPILQAFQEVVNLYDIDHKLIEAFLYSMAMDLSPKSYEQGLYEEYIYGSAEVVGLMCLKIFCVESLGLYDSLKDAARSLGAAFQKVNFLRDIRSDLMDRGRTYFPGINMDIFSDADKAQIEAEIRADFAAAYAGIILLPKSSRHGVCLAYSYYLKLFSKIERLPATRILHERIRVPDPQKLALLLRSYFQAKLDFI